MKYSNFTRKITFKEGELFKTKKIIPDKGKP